MSFIGFVFPPCVAYCQALGADGKVTKSLLEDRFSEKEWDVCISSLDLISNIYKLCDSCEGTQALECGKEKRLGNILVL